MVMPQILPLRDRSRVMRQVIEERLDGLLPGLMRETGLDMWLVICQEDDYDPVFWTLMPPDSWCPILQILVFHDRGGEAGVERISLARTNTAGLYQQPWNGPNDADQMPLLAELIAERKPRRIGLNTGAIEWAAGGLTHNLYTQLTSHLAPDLVGRLESAEPLVTRWLASLSDREIGLFETVVRIAHALLGECLSARSIAPGVTTTDDLEWHYWQRSLELGLEVSFRPFFRVIRRESQKACWPEGDKVIRPGDLLHSDVGIRYLGLDSDHQQVAYILRPGESAAPAGLRRLLSEANRLQDIYRGEFRAGLTGNELLTNILTRARAEGIPNPKVYSHSLGHLLHEPGPLIGLPWEQACCPGRGDVALHENYAFTMELNVRDTVPEWDGQEVTMPVEEDVVFQDGVCRMVDGRETELFLV